MNIIYRTEVVPDTASIIALFESSGINRPITDYDRIQQMFLRADLIVSAWEGELLVGVARALTDFCYCCYLSDLAVRKEHQRQGIGKRLIDITKEHAGEQATLILVSAPAAIDYYPKIGMARLDSAFAIRRTR